MSRTLSVLLLTLASACAASSPEIGVADASATMPRTWRRAMQQVDRHVGAMTAELDRVPAGNLQLAAAAARDAAELVRDGYGEFRQPQVPGFARMARDAESWLLRLAAEAGQGRGAIARAMLRDGEAQHCQRCHDACEAARW